MDDLTKLIDTLVQQKTFSLDAVGSIKELRDKAADLETKLKKAEEYGKRRDMELQQNAATIGARDLQVKRWETREKELSEREAKVTDLEKSTAVAQAESHVMRDVFHTIFRNTIVRETTNRDVPVVRNYAGGSGDYVEHRIAKTEVARETE